jgi:hypothetical protein
MTVAPIAIVSALRETSVLFGALIAIIILKEPLRTSRVAAALLIVAGLTPALLTHGSARCAITETHGVPPNVSQASSLRFCCLLRFCCTHDFRLDRIVEHNPCLLHLWSKRRTKLLLQAPYQCHTERNEMRRLY